MRLVQRNKQKADDLPMGFSVVGCDGGNIHELAAPSIQNRAGA